MILVATYLLVSPLAMAQDWGSESDDNWSSAPRSQSPVGQRLGWSARLGIGFTIDPDTFLLNLEAPYAFDPWVSVGPMMQIGIDNDDSIWAPTVNTKITIPDMPGEGLDRFVPFFMGGLGFAVLRDDDRRNNKSSAGFLVNTGFGLDFRISEHLFVGSQMIFNFLPDRTLGEKFWYSWEVIGFRVGF